MTNLHVDITGLGSDELLGLLDHASAEKLLALELAGKDKTGRAACPFCARVKGVSAHREDCPLEARLVACGVDAHDDE